jgi:hypothetical protein
MVFLKCLLHRVHRLAVRDTFDRCHFVPFGLNGKH